MDPYPMADPHHHLEYSWTLSWYAGLDSDHLREAQEIDQLRRQESDRWRMVTAYEQEAGYQKGDLRQDMEHAGLFNARSVLSFILEEVNSLPPLIPPDDDTYDGRYLRELMSNEEKLFELHRIQRLPRTSGRRFRLDVLRELDNSATLAFYRKRADIKRIQLGERSLWISKRNGEKLYSEMSRLIEAQAPRTFTVTVTTEWQRREVQRRAIELRNQSLNYKSTGVRYHLYPNYIIDSNLVLEHQEPLKLPTTHYEELIKQAAAFLSRVEGKTTCRPDVQIRVQDLRRRRTLEERAFEEYRRNTGGSDPNSGTEETAILVAMRLARDGHEIPFLRSDEALGRYSRIREQIQETLCKAHKAIARQGL